MLSGKPQRILIKTYTHESGLWYLGLSLYQELTKVGHKVKIIPKSKFIKRNGRYTRIYVPGIPEFKDLVIPFSVDKTVGIQVAQAIADHRATTLISMETMMESSSWINNIKKRTKIKVIDVPMLEWVSARKLNGGAYNVFSEIWATTDFTKDTFTAAGNRKTKRIDWNYVDRELFFENKNKANSAKFSFYHQGSLNPAHSSKNTDLVIKAFDKLTCEVKGITLSITGNVSDPKLNKIIEKHANIKVYNRVLSRQEIAGIYKNTNCVVAPSSREGLCLSLFEAKACGCELITTDAPPMNSHNTKYLCKTSSMQYNGSLVPIARLSVDSVYEQMKKVYEERHVR